MNAGRPLALTVSNSRQYRETLRILLEPDFTVAQFSEPTRLAAVPAAASVVVLAPSAWDSQWLMGAAARPAETALVVLDPPNELRGTIPDAIVASWADPLSLRDAVARSVLRPEAVPRIPSPAADIIATLGIEIGRPVKMSLVLARLAQVVRSSTSSFIAKRMLGERLQLLIDELQWISVAGPNSAEPRIHADFARALRHSIEGRRMRFACRDIEILWETEAPFPIACPPSDARAIAGCLAAYLLHAAPPGVIVIRAHSDRLTCSYGNPPIQVRRGLLSIADRLLSSTGCRLIAKPGSITLSSVLN